MKNNHYISRYLGFTLLEILIALFIFSILSLIMAAALRTVINAQAGAENKAQRLRQWQMALLVMSRDIEQAVDRPVINATGKEEAAFIGEPTSFTFTHTGYANLSDTIRRSHLQRTGYVWRDEALWRFTLPVLDAAPKTKIQKRQLVSDVITNAHFQYLAQTGRFYDHWPLEHAQDESSLPRGVKISFTVSPWGELTQFYLIPVQVNQHDKPKES